MDPANLPLQKLIDVLAANFPDAAPFIPVRILGVGFRRVAIETSDGWVLHIPRIRNEGMVYTGPQESLLLAEISDRLPIPVPRPAYFQPARDFPLGLWAYRKLEGVPLDPAQLATSARTRYAQDIASFLAVLHSLNLEEPSVPGPDPGGHYFRETTHAFERTIPTLRSCLSAAEFRLVMTWWQGFRFDKKMLRFNPVLVHGDLWYGNVLSDPETGSLTGILDFEDAALDDPAQDFATLLHSGNDFTALVIEAYRKAGGSFDDNMLYRMRKLWSGREFGGLAYAVEMQDEAELEEALDKLRRGPILNPEPHNEGFRYLEMQLELK